MARSTRSRTSARKATRGKTTGAARSSTQAQEKSYVGKARSKSSAAGPNSKQPNSKGSATKGALRPSVRMEVVLSPHAKGSSLAQEGVRVFALGVQRVLRKAAKRNSRVPVQGPNGKIVKAVPSKQGGAFVVVDHGHPLRVAASKAGSSAKRQAR